MRQKKVRKIRKPAYEVEKFRGWVGIKINKGVTIERFRGGIGIRFN